MTRAFGMLSVCLVIAVLFLIGAAPLQVQAQEKVIKLKYSDFFAPSHKNGLLAQQWCKEVEKRTNGRIKITHFPGGTLTPPPQTYDSVVKGIADIGHTLAAYSAGRFLLTEVLGQPIGFTSGYQATKTANEYYKKFKPKEFDDTKIMYIHGHGPGMFQTVKPVSSIDEVKGLRIKANTENAAIATALGAAPVALPITETYDACQKGLVDGLLLPIEPLKGWKFADVIKTVIDCPTMAYTAPICVFMNKDKWNSLSKEDQATIEKINEEWVEKQAKQWNELDKEATELANQKGIKLIKATPEQAKNVGEKMKAVKEEWAKKTAAKGLPAQEALDFCIEYVKKNP
ncbi:MAG: TRAP transporter substrate-binding protein [Desulfomonile tiedjei]|nr:TRAP transporter substrate-binding protein [Desulfomonile tiedjei]